jgi:NitT/TauT family transport system ATP-binding protein
METAARGSRLSVRGVEKRYARRGSEAGMHALSGIDFEVCAGEFVAVVGPSGCGKTTLLRIIAGLEAATAGEVLVDGTPVAGPAPDRGLMFQDYALFPWKTVWGNVEFGPRARHWSAEVRRSVVRRYIDLVGLAGFERRYPYELSGGMRQRCAFARLLASEPAVLLLDEPLAALDAQTRSIMQEETLQIWGEEQPRLERRTVVYVTHSIEEAVHLADRVLVLNGRPGAILADISIDLPRPRHVGSEDPSFARYVDQIWRLIRDEASRAIQASS